MKLIDVIIAIVVIAAVAYISISYLKFPYYDMYDAVSLKASILNDINMMREKKESVSVLTIRKSYKRLIIGKNFRKIEEINLKSVYSSCSGFDERIEYTYVFPKCAGTIYADGWSISFQPVTGYMTIKLDMR